MFFKDRLETQDISSIFANEISLAGGTVHETFDDGTRLFARSVVPRMAEVLRDDGVQGGVAIRVTGDELSVNPYTFRLICQNGAIRAQAIQSRVIDIAELADADECE